MNEHLDHDDPVLARNERELTLSTGAILGIFFGLVVLCGLCFGVGYNMGRKSTPTPLALNDTNADTAPSDTGTTAKPAAGSPAEGAGTTSGTISGSSPQPAVAVVPASPSPTPKAAPVVRKPPPPDPAAGSADEDPSTPARSTPPSHPAEVAAAPTVHTVPPSALSPSAAPTSGTGSVMVQVAAVSHQEDADLLVGALRSRGYAVSARPAASDGFIHVQVGPFSDKKAAEAMRQRLLSDGYNAILK